ncbi:MAG: helix-turn-helix transcriptional regulator [Lachnospiraceae bacterium]|nr:helix-turn-helix transcriptional regulator [Lachnospiraceae bacterium]
MAIYIEEKTKFGQVVLGRLKELGRTQVWLSKETGLTKVYISQMCSDITKRPSFDAIFRISTALDIEPSSLTTAVLEDQKNKREW